MECKMCVSVYLQHLTQDLVQFITSFSSPPTSTCNMTQVRCVNVGGGAGVGGSMGGGDGGGRVGVGWCVRCV